MLILVVDDLAIFREPIEAALKAAGFDTMTTGNGRDAVELMGRRRPDLVFLDLGMPVMDGLTALSIMRRSPVLRHVPVIILSAEGERSQVQRAAALGISGYILKSRFSLQDMLQRVHNVLNGSKSKNDNVASSIPSSAKSAASSPASAEIVQQLEASTAVADPHASDVESIKSVKPILTRSDILDRLKTCEELSGFSPAVSKVLQLTRDDKAGLNEICRAISQDQAMAIKILKIANSAAYNRDDRVGTVHKAVMRIGLQSIRQVVLNIGVVERFSAPAFDEILSTQQFWEHSIAVGIIAAEIAQALDMKDADLALTGGLLHDLGRAIFAEILGQKYIDVIEQANRIQAPLEVVESRMLLLNHTDVMDRLLSVWKFPKELIEPIMHHHLSVGNSRSLSRSRLNEVLRLGLANRLAHALMLGSSGNECLYPTEDHCKALRIPASVIQHITLNARQQTDDTKFALLSNASGAQGWPRRIDQVRETLVAPFRPLFISADPELDAIRIFCDELKEASGDDPPNIAVVHLANARDREAFAERLHSHEQERGGIHLPLIVLSAAAQKTLPDRIIKGRPYMLLPTPFAVTRFIAAVNTLIQGASPGEGTQPR